MIAISKVVVSKTFIVITSIVILITVRSAGGNTDRAPLPDRAHLPDRGHMPGRADIAGRAHLPGRADIADRAHIPDRADRAHIPPDLPDGRSIIMAEANQTDHTDPFGLGR